jgi:hypothetical protein
MTKVGSDYLHPLLAEKKPTKVQQIYFRVALDDIRHEYWVEGGGYLTEDNQLWVPSWRRVWEKVLPEETEVYKDAKWYVPKGRVQYRTTKVLLFSQTHSINPTSRQRGWC